MLTIIRYMHVLIIFPHLEEFLDSKHLQRAAISYASLWWLFNKASIYFNTANKYTSHN
jgi:hypothetical protein